MSPIYEFYPTLENGLAPTMDAAEFDCLEAALCHARRLLEEHISAEKVVGIREGKLAATVVRVGPPAADHLST